MSSLFYGQESTSLAGKRSRAVFLAEEGLEAVRNIRDSGFTNLTDGIHGLVISGNQWSFSGSSDVIDGFTREVQISTVGTNRKQVSSRVEWVQNQQRDGEVEAVTLLTFWQEVAAVISTCNDYAVSEGYSGGTCRQNTTQCGRNDQVHLSDGDEYCTGGPSQDTCCATP